MTKIDLQTRIDARGFLLICGEIRKVVRGLLENRDDMRYNNRHILCVVFVDGGLKMAVSYNRLWKLLVDRKMSKADLRKQAEIAPNTMTKLRRDEEVTLGVLGKICKTLDVDYGDIMEYVKE